MISCRYNEASEWQAGLRRFQKALGIAQSGVSMTTPPHAATKEPGRYLGSAPGRLRRPRTWAAASRPRRQEHPCPTRSTCATSRPSSLAPRTSTSTLAGSNLGDRTLVDGIAAVLNGQVELNAKLDRLLDK